MRSFLASMLGLTFLLTACNGGGESTSGATGTDTTDGTTTGTTGTTTSGTPTTTEPATSSTTGEPTTGTPTTGTPTTGTTEPATTGTTTTDATTGTTTDTTDTTTDTEGTTGEPGMCAPEPGDDECTLCIKDGCCEEAVACSDNDDCACIFACIGMGGDPASCGQTCGANPFQVPEFLAVVQCVMGSCGMPCGL